VADDVFGDLPTDQAVFDRGWVDKLRREGQRYREQATTNQAALDQYQQVFAPYDDGDRQVWLDLARTWVSDPAKAARVMQEIASGVLADGTPTEAADTATAVLDATADVDTSTMTPEQVQQMISDAIGERDKAAAEHTAIEGVYAEMRAGGFEPETRWGMMVLHAANHETNGDIAEAMKLVQADRQAIIDEYVQGRANGTRAVPSPSGGVVAASHEPIQNLDDARRHAEAYLREAQVRQPG
jgi:hypothetical protein